MRPILSATGTYNYTHAKWLDEKLKPLSVNNHTISDVFQFAEEIRELDFNEDDILVSYDVSALFTNVSLEETIQILANKAFNQNCDPPQEFDAKGESTLTTRLACRRSRICAY